MARTLGRGGKLKVAIADDSGLIFSDDYRSGWTEGFRAVGAEVKVFDISMLRRMRHSVRSPYRSITMPGTQKGLAGNITAWGADLVWCHHGRAASNPEFLAGLKKGGAVTAVYLCDEPYETGETAKYSPGFDYVFTMDPCTVEVHRKSRPRRNNVFYLPPGVDTNLFKPRPYYNKAGELQRKTPAFFLGNASLIPRPEWLKPIERLVDGADIRFFNTVGKNDKRWIPAQDHPKWYGGCVVGLNVHRSPVITMECFKMRVLGRGPHDRIPAGITLCAQMPRRQGTGFWNDGNLPAAHVNPRFLEMAACSTLVVSDNDRSELARMFPMAPRADDPDHFYELVTHYINHPDEAEWIGQTCSSLISRRHSYAHRAAEVAIRLGFRGSLKDDLLSYLGPQEDWLTPQDCGPLGIESFLARTGRSERWSPQLGMSLTRVSGSPSDSDSIDVQTPWL